LSNAITLHNTNLNKLKYYLLAQAIKKYNALLVIKSYAIPVTENTIIWLLANL